jgi:hypothetical protein
MSTKRMRKMRPGSGPWRNTHEIVIIIVITIDTIVAYRRWWWRWSSPIATAADCRDEVAVAIFIIWTRSWPIAMFWIAYWDY